MVRAEPEARMITRNPSVLHGEPTLAGTRVPVRAVVLMHRTYDQDLDLVCEALPTLTRADTEAALQFYREHRDEIDTYIRQNDVDEDLLREAP